ncbi:MAG TPA: AMP-binding protein, partial [Acidimicrobiales bacterium]
MTQEVPYGRRIADLAAERGDEPALVFAATSAATSGAAPGAGDETLTWRDLDRRSNQVARALAGRGVELGDRVGIELHNSVELVLVVLGAWKLGATPVPMRWDLPDWERTRLVDVLGGRIVVGDPGIVAAAGSLSADPLPDVVPPHSWGICSSGTTGSPKIILLTKPGVFDPETAAPFAASWGDVDTPQTVLVPAPLYHTNGFSGVTMMLSGDTMVLLERFDAARIVDLIERHRVTTFTATPTMLQRIARVPGLEKRDLSSIRWVLQGAAVIPPSLVREWIGLVGPERFIMAYGMTEQLGLCALRGDEWLRHPGSVGKPIREGEVRVLDEAGHELAAGQIGEIYLRSP